MIKKMVFMFCLISFFSFFSFAQDWELVWDDEFNGTVIDKEKWSWEVNGDGGGNAEQQYYTDRADNSYIEKTGDESYLVIKSKREEYLGSSWTSARLRSKFKGDWTYGRVETRVKLPRGNGVWPAFWMMPSQMQRDAQLWAKIGEIDIMENVNNHDTVYGTLHFGEAWPENLQTQHDGVELADKEQWNTFAIEWTPTEITWYVNGALIHSKGIADLEEAGGEWIFSNRPFYLIMNLAMGGFWPNNDLTGSQWTSSIDYGSPTPDENLYCIDYVRVYKNEQTLAVEGKNLVYRDTPYVEYSVNFPAGSFVWDVPAGFTILNGQGTDTISVSVNDKARNGQIRCLVDGAAAVKDVLVEVPETYLVSDFDGNGEGEFTFHTGPGTIVDNPQKSGLNTSDKCLFYQRDAAQQWDNFKITNLSIADLGLIKGTKAKVLIDVYLTDGDYTAKPVSVTFENSAKAAAAPDWDGNSGRGYTLKGDLPGKGKWVTMEFLHSVINDEMVNNFEIDAMTIMINSGHFTGEKVYMDNIRIVSSGNGYSESAKVMDFDGISLADIDTQTSGVYSVVPNPAPDSINDSAAVLKYVRDKNSEWDVFVLNNVDFIENSYDFQYCNKVIKMDVYTPEDFTGTIVGMNLEHEALADAADPTDGVTGRDTSYQALVTEQGKWETLTFNYHTIRDWVGVEKDMIDQIIFMFDPGTASAQEYYIDNIRIEDFNEDAPDSGTGPVETMLPISGVSASSELMSAGNAIDSDPATRWESFHGVDPSYITFDLGTSRDITKLVIDWEAANARTYEVQFSNDGTVFTTAAVRENMVEGMHRIDTVEVSGKAKYVRIYGTERNLVYGYSIFEVQIYGLDNGTGNPLKQIQPSAVFASSELQSAGNAIDANSGTRWESLHGIDPSFITLDFGSVKNFKKILIDWEAANASDYEIGVSADGVSFTTIKTLSDMPEGMHRIDEVTLEGTGRYLRINGTERNLIYGYSIFEITVYE